MNRHLNVFVPYERDRSLEDDLTRAAMIIIRYVPLAREAFLCLSGAPSLTNLATAGDVEIQTRDVLPRGGSGELGQLISVFLTPDEASASEQPVTVSDSDRGQRLDGVLRFEQDLAIVVESKIREGADAWQASTVNLAGVESREDARVKRIAWHDLLEAWRRLQDLTLLTPAENLLMEDLFDFAEDAFPQVMPFRKLHQARGHEGRLGRFLRNVLWQATGITPADRDNYVRLDETLGARSVQRAYLSVYEKGLYLRMYPAEDKGQALQFYAEGRGTRCAVLNEDDKWCAYPNLYLAFRNAPYGQRLYTHNEVKVDEYVARWSGDDLDWVRAYSVDEARAKLWPWLLERGYASPTDDIDGFLTRVGKRDVLLRPSMAVEHYWSWEAAEAADLAGQLQAQVRDAINKVLRTLDEPTLSDRVIASATA
jgi:hypothetical protein